MGEPPICARELVSHGIYDEGAVVARAKRVYNARVRAVVSLPSRYFRGFPKNGLMFFGRLGLSIDLRDPISRRSEP